MTSEEWHSCDDATHMLRTLYAEQPEYFRDQIIQLHRFLIACAWKHSNLIPQQGLREGLRGAERWISGEIDDEELNRLNWHAEAEAFKLDYAEEPDELRDIAELISGIKELDGMTFQNARQALLKAAYFAECVMVYPGMRPGPWIERLFESEFLCPDLLREHLDPNFSAKGP